MIDISKLTYKLLLLCEDGSLLNISNAVSDLGWEEGESELACRISVTLQNLRFKGVYLMELAKPGCQIRVHSGAGELKEIVRGVITEWEPSLSGSQDSFGFVAYDELFYLQQSQDNHYIESGTGTKTVISEIFEKWQIPYVYEGPDVPHAKKMIKDDYLSDTLLELLTAAKHQGAGSYLIRAEESIIKILPEGSNDEVYHFSEDSNLQATRDKISTSNLVTRVKILGKEDEDGRQEIEGTLDGKTEYGIRQRIYHFDDVDTLATATAAAQQILDEQGDVERELSLEGPDVPFIRKGDKIYLSTRLAKGYYVVRSVKHNAASYTMSLVIEALAETTVVAEETALVAAEESKEFAKGDAVILNGALYRDSYGNGKGNTCTDYRTTITMVVDLSRPCPYHVGEVGWGYPHTIIKA